MEKGMNKKPSKKLLQKELLTAYKRGERILDHLVEFQRIYNLDIEETKRLVSKAIREKMFQQEKSYKTVLTKRPRHLLNKKPTSSTKIKLDVPDDL